MQEETKEVRFGPGGLRTRLEKFCNEKISYMAYEETSKVDYSA